MQTGCGAMLQIVSGRHLQYCRQGPCIEDQEKTETWAETGTETRGSATPAIYA